MGKQYVVESDFEDLHGNPAEEQDLEVDFESSDNPIIRAARGERVDDDDWTPPEDAEDKETADDEDDSEDEDEDIEVEDEESDDDEDEPGEEEEDDEDKAYSKNVQKRIERERQLRLKADQRLEAMERKFALREEKDKFVEFKAEQDAKLEKLLAKKEEAYEEGDSKAQARLDDEILEIKSEVRARKSDLERREKELEKAPADVDSGDDTPEPGRKWLNKYPEFHSNKRFQDAVLQADKMIARQGFDKNTDEYYEKIEDIVAVTFPNIVKTRKAKISTKRKTRRKKPAVGGGGKPGAGRTKSRRRGKVRLTKEDQANMRIFNLDPKNAEHVKEWVANKTGD